MKYLIIFIFFIFNTAISDTKNSEDDYFFVGKIISIQDNVDDEFLEVRVEFLGIPEEQDFFLIFTG